MKRRIRRTFGALALFGAWMFVPIGRLLGSSNGLLWFLSALGLLAGASLGWLGQYLLGRPMTRHALTGAGWTVSALLLALIFRDAVTGRWALANIALIVACAGSLAWSVRLLLPRAGDDSLAQETSRELQVGISHVTHAETVKPAPRASGRRVTPVTPLVPQRTKPAPAAKAPRPKDQETG